jgi:hypothetical protein
VSEPELNRKERRVRTGEGQGDVVAAALCYAIVSAIHIWQGSPGLAAVWGLGALVWYLRRGKRLVLTDQRLFVFFPALEKAAKLIPALRGIRRKSRKSIDLKDIRSARAEGGGLFQSTKLKVFDAEGKAHTFSRTLTNVESAREFADEIEVLISQSKTSAPAEARVGPPPSTLPLTVTTAGSSDLRCPYCHDSFREDDSVAPCSDCATPHHDECLQIHGRCSLSGCNGKARPPRLRS